MFHAFQVLETVQKVLVFALFFILLILFFSFFLLTFFTRIEVIKLLETVEKELYQHRVLRIDIEKNTTTRGIVLSNSIEEGFLSEVNGNRLILVSNFGSGEYICSGSCFCFEELNYFEEDSDLQRFRRESVFSSSTTKGILFLVSAVTSSFAFNIAREYFSQECEKHLEATCPYSSIRSEVGNCEEFDVDFEETGELELSKDGPSIPTTSFVCHGNCSRSSYTEFMFGTESKNIGDFSESTSREISRNPKFESLWAMIEEDLSKYDDSLLGDDGEAVYFERERYVDKAITEITRTFRNFVDCNDLSLTSTVEVERVGSFSYQERMAISNFYSLNLFKFCRSNGFLDFGQSETNKEKIRRFVMEQRKEREMTLGNIWNAEYWKQFPGIQSASVLRFHDRLPAESYNRLVDVILEFVPYGAWRLCRASITTHSDKAIGNNDMNMNVVCRRQFTDEEWERGIPYEHNNLRHWKESYQNV